MGCVWFVVLPMIIAIPVYSLAMGTLYGVDDCAHAAWDPGMWLTVSGGVNVGLGVMIVPLVVYAWAPIVGCGNPYKPRRLIPILSAWGIFNAAWVCIGSAMIRGNLCSESRELHTALCITITGNLVVVVVSAVSVWLSWSK